MARAPLDPAGGSATCITVKMRPRDARLLTRLAMRENITRSEFLRSLIRADMERRGLLHPERESTGPPGMVAAGSDRGR